MHELFVMGGYGAYVWPAYGVTFLVLSINVFVSLRQKKQVKKIITDYLTQPQ